MELSVPCCFSQCLNQVKARCFIKVRKSSSSQVEIWAMFTKITMENVTYPLGTSHLHLIS